MGPYIQGASVEFKKQTNLDSNPNLMISFISLPVKREEGKGRKYLLSAYYVPSSGLGNFSYVIPSNLHISPMRQVLAFSLLVIH